MMKILEERRWYEIRRVALLAGLGRLPHDRELVDPGHRGAADGPVDRLPARPVLAQTGDDIRRRRVLTVLPHALGLDHPLVPVAGPVALAEPAFGIEDPRLELVARRVPADPLRAREHGLALRLHGELADQVVAAVGPFAGGEDDRILALI